MDMRLQLQGAWRLGSVIEGGVETMEGERGKHFLWIRDDAIITGSSDAAWEMPFVVVRTDGPIQIDITRTDRWEPWIDRAIIQVENDILLLCAAGSPDRGRPDHFESSTGNGWTLYSATRCNEPAPE